MIATSRGRPNWFKKRSVQLQSISYHRSVQEVLQKMMEHVFACHTESKIIREKLIANMVAFIVEVSAGSQHRRELYTALPSRHIQKYPLLHFKKALNTGLETFQLLAKTGVSYSLGSAVDWKLFDTTCFRLLQCTMSLWKTVWITPAFCNVLRMHFGFDGIIRWSQRSLYKNVE